MRLLEAAYSLGTESWLAAEEADDLVAVLPDADFEAFVTKGSLRRVYRVLIPPGQRTVGAHVLEDLLNRRCHTIQPQNADYGVAGVEADLAE